MSPRLIAPRWMAAGVRPARIAMIPRQILGLVYTVVRSLLDLLSLCRKTEATLQIEVLALRHQPRVLERQVNRPRFQAADRLLLSALSRILPRPAWHSFLVSPGTR